jgi:hypothetical protein
MSRAKIIETLAGHGVVLPGIGAAGSVMGTPGQTTDQFEAAVADIARSVSAGRCILFLGAGVHYPPPEDSSYSYPEQDRPPLGAALSLQLAGECDFKAKCPNDSDRNLQRVSLCYELFKSRKQLVDKIREAVDVGKKPSPALRALARLPFSLVITTNYDRLFERALQREEKDPRSIVYAKEPEEPTKDYLDPNQESPVILKIHGSIEEPESIVVTDEDYIQFVLRMTDKDPYHPVPETFRYNLKRWNTLFVGYSLLDYNLRLLFKIMRWQIDPANIPETYSVDKYPDPLILDVWENQNRYVRFIAQDLWRFVPELYRRVMGEEMPV